MAAVDDQDPVQQFAADSSDPAFGDRVRPVDEVYQEVARC
jgi:hypothetical protein